MSTQRGNKNSDAIRILQRDRDASARATHLKAEIGMVPNSTIERKIMSTKTSIKRIALVAAAALTLGGFSAVSANAVATSTTYPFYVSAADSGVQSAVATTVAGSATGVAGTYNYVQFTAGLSSDFTTAGTTVGISASAGAGSITVATQPTTPGANQDTFTVSGLTAVDKTGYISGAVIKVGTPTAGSFTVTITKNVVNATTGAVTTTTLQTYAITVNAASVVGAYSAANSFATRIDTTTTNVTAFAAYETPTVTSATADSTAALTKGTAGASSPVSIIAVRLRDTQANPGALAGASVAASISGVGLVQGTGTATDTASVNAFNYNGGVAATVASSTTDANGWAFFNVLNGGQSGVGTVTITYNDGTSTYTVATKSFTFYGALSTLKATQGKYIIANSGAATGGTTSTTYAVQFTGTDSAGNAVDVTTLASSIVGTSDLTTAIASTTTQSCAADLVNTSALDCTVTGAATAVAGTTANVTYSYTDGDLVKHSASPIAFTIGGTTVSSVAITFDAASYNIGDLVTATLTAKDSKGNLVADKTYTLFDTATSTTVLSSSAQLTSTPFGSKYISFKKGVATATFYAPYTTGTLNVSAVIGGTTGTAWNDAADTLAGTTIKGSVSIAGASGDSSLAYDAASAATDAANNAYEEAQNATQAASDALAAVKALAVQVKALIALVNKIKAKLKA